MGLVYDEVGERKQAEIFEEINNKFGDQFTNFEDRVSPKLTVDQQGLPECGETEVHRPRTQRQGESPPGTEQP